MLIPIKDLIRKYRIKPNGIFHIGANVGEERNDYLSAGVTKQIWIEANPEIYKTLLKNISNNPDARAFNLCVGDENKEVTFHISNNGSQSSSVLELGVHKISHPEVDYIEDIQVGMFRIDSLFWSATQLKKDSDYDYDTTGFDFLNLDLQGAELMALKGMGELLHQFKYVYCEVNEKELYLGCPLKQEIYDYLFRFGFKLREEKMTDFFWGDSFLSK